MIEVELKFELPYKAEAMLSARLEAQPSCTRLGQTIYADTYYDTPGFDCLQQAVFLRIRNQTHLDIKYHERADPAHLHCSEQTFPLSTNPLQIKAMNELCARFLPAWQEARTIEDALHHNGLVPFVRLKNRRTRYKYEHLTLCVDHVAGLGSFFEIETCCRHESEVREAQTRLHDFVDALDLPILRQVNVGYVELWLRSHLPQVYRLGVYRTEDDVEQNQIIESDIGLADKVASFAY
jgi:adenylate cyclase, class 2